MSIRIIKAPPGHAIDPSGWVRIRFVGGPLHAMEEWDRPSPATKMDTQHGRYTRGPDAVDHLGRTVQTWRYGTEAAA